ncbi:OLC1v1023992C1 [Oldenlandia corymbosa var. corymbosa]|uniref:OLC1v1023992C1 n=1 Tax=Oldenlandia corymbosa var. corymbosa TaxID=529605 RepID=A0AAV1C1S4_OLDCO|nr:OLC1v1023992C1 [Oldenlandia corymbosa var. corymbosa]
MNEREDMAPGGGRSSSSQSTTDHHQQQQLINKINKLLKLNNELNLKGIYLKPELVEWYKSFTELHLRWVKTMVCYTGKWSEEDKANYLPSSTTPRLQYHLDQIFYFVSGYHYRDHQTTQYVVHFASMALSKGSGRWPRHLGEFQDRFALDCGKLLRIMKSQPRVPGVGDFYEFESSVREFLGSIPLELGSFDRLVRNFRRFSSGHDWSTSLCVAVDTETRAVATSLQTLARLIRKLEQWLCSFPHKEQHEEKLQGCISVAGALVLEVVLVASRSQMLNRSGYVIPNTMTEGCAEMSRALSVQNPQVTEVYGQVLDVYWEIIKVAAQQIHDFRAFLQLVEKHVDIVHDILDNPLMDLVEKLEDHNSKVETWLKLRFAPVVREANSFLTSAIPNILHLKLLQKLEIIKAEMFIQELHHLKSKFCGSNRAATIRDAFQLLNGLFNTPDPEVCLDDAGKAALIRIEALFREAGRLTDDVAMFKSSLGMYKLFKLEATVTVLIDTGESSKFQASYRLETLQKSLLFLRALLSDPTNDDYVEDGNVSTFIEALVDQTTTLVCSLGNYKIEKNQPTKFDVFLPHLSKKIELNSAQIKAAYQESHWRPFLSFPKKDGFHFVVSLLEDLKRLLTDKPDIVSFWKDQVEEWLAELKVLCAFLRDSDGQRQVTSEEQHLICLIYEAEYIIQLFEVKDGPPVWFQKMVLFNAIEEIKMIKSHLLQYFNHNKATAHDDVHQPPLGSGLLQPSNPATDEVVVGFDDHANFIIDSLKSGPPERQIHSIVGMGGLGKTTLAKKVFDDISIQYHFAVRAWCSVSQVYRKRDLLLDLLDDFVQITDEFKRKDDNDIAQTLYQRLKRKRYLIVMDDMWSIEPWRDLMISLPNDSTGSRILFTSRYHEVALQREPYVLPLLSERESWVLFQEKLFPGGTCPEHLQQVGRLIARNCKGLPLAIVVIAGLLKNIEVRKNRYEEFAHRFRTYIVDSQQSQLMDILEFSYHHLPPHLKPCFLYMGTFVEDQEVPAQKLKMWWIAEGFIQKMAGSSLEETAEAYLVELRSRSLVIEAKKRSTGRGTKTCRIHDMLRDLCLEKAREENFMQLISKRNAGGNSFTSMLYRLCVHSAKRHFVNSELFGPHVRSLLYFPTDESTKGSSKKTCSFENFQLLRVLDLEHMTLGRGFPPGIESMIRLNYLAVGGSIGSIPSSIAQLLNLETLIVKGTRPQVVVPSTLWSMSRLRYVKINPRAVFDLSGPEFENSVVLGDLIALSSPVFGLIEEVEKLLKRLIRLSKLRIILGRTSLWHYFGKFPELAGCLDRLESLKISYHGPVFSVGVCFPLNLKKLTMSNFRLPWRHIEAVRQLPNLEVLKLESRAFEGKTWDMSDGEDEIEFPKLKYLKLRNLNLAEWNASADNFPSLERLVVQSCRELEEVPCSFGEIYTLQMVEMKWCSPSATASLDPICQQQQEELGNLEFKVLKVD